MPLHLGNCRFLEQFLVQKSTEIQAKGKTLHDMIINYTFCIVINRDVNQSQS